MNPARGANSLIIHSYPTLSNLKIIPIFKVLGVSIPFLAYSGFIPHSSNLGEQIGEQITHYIFLFPQNLARPILIAGGTK